jgi:ABC-type cobalamin transport system ATPase subunit
VANAASRDASIRAVAFTSALSPALEELLRGRTSFVIAHRLSTIRHADQVLALKDGQIIERGTHEELLQARGFYYDLYMSQFRRDIDFAEEGAAPVGATGR